MKITYNAGPDRIDIQLTRDSVCAGDDMDAPHEKTLRLPSLFDPESLTKAAAKNYLPNVVGTGHSWTFVLNDEPIAIIKASGEVEKLVQRVTYKHTKHVTGHFVYHCSKN